ncbi:MAG: septum formation protein Maf [Bacteroidia bacterium]
MMNSNHKLLLGSKSPRRKQILEMAGFDFKTVAINCDESYPDTLLPKDVPEYLAKKKSMAMATLNKGELLITSDTIVVLDDEILEKPSNHNHAIEMLFKMSGKSHLVYTGVCLRSIDKSVSFVDQTEVNFKAFSTDELEYYVSNYKPFDKAGAYGVQEWAGMVGVNYIRGSFYTVMGLPIHRVYKEIKEF